MTIHIGLFVISAICFAIELVGPQMKVSLVTLGLLFMALGLALGGM